jgi:hypothetical protein
MAIHVSLAQFTENCIILQGVEVQTPVNPFIYLKYGISSH